MDFVFLNTLFYMVVSVQKQFAMVQGSGLLWAFVFVMQL